MSEQRLIDANALIRKFKTASPMAVDGRARQMVEDMPTIEPKKGNWVGIDDEPYDDWECDRCGEIVTDCGWDALPNFCPNCGCRMQEGEDNDSY